MWRALVRRLLISIPVLFAVTILVFFLTALTPGDPARTILGTQATPEAIAAINEQLGLDQPIVVQYWGWLTQAVQGNLGTSIYTAEPVANIIANALPVTVTLIILSVLVSVTLGVPIGILSARHRSSGGQLIDGMSLLGYAIPPFFLGLLLVLVFSTLIPLFPSSGWVDPTVSLGEWARSLVLPVTTLSLAGAAVLARQTRQSMIEVFGREYIRSLRARGVSQRAIVYRHALRNAGGNVVTLLGLYIVSLLLGSTLVETVFAIQGLGTVAVQATTQHNLPVLVGTALFFTLIVVAAFICVDVTRAGLNPKLRTR